jgi:rod shape-determining protein MreC
MMRGDGHSRMVDQAVSCLIYPLLVVQQRCIVPIKAWFEHRRDSVELQEKIRLLQQEKEDLMTAVIRLQAGKTYADDIQELIDFKRRYTSSNVLLAHVLVRNFSDQSHFFIIDVGSNKGIVPDMVVVYKDHLVGRVIDVYPWYSKVMLITDRLCKVSAYCCVTRSAGIYTGKNADMSTELTRVSHLSPVLEDELILATGDGLVFPRGFALGRVCKVNVNGLFYTIQAEPLIDIRTLSYCFVMQKGVELESEEKDQFQKA